MALRVLSYHPSQIAIDGEILALRIARLDPEQALSFNASFRKIGSSPELAPAESEAEEKEAKAFIGHAIKAYVTLDPGQLFIDGSEVTAGEDLLRIFGARDAILSELLMTIYLENTLNSDQKAERARSLAPFVPTPPDVAARMMALADVKVGDVFLDPACGAGALCIAAALTGARAIGLDSDRERVEEATAAAVAAGVGELCRFSVGDGLKADITGVTAVGLYLLPSTTLRMRDKLAREGQRGTRVVSHAFPLSGWTHDAFEYVAPADGAPPLHGGYRQIYAYRVP